MFSRMTKVMPVMLALIMLAAGALPTLAAPPGPDIVQVALAVNGEDSPFEGQFDTLIAAVLAADPAVAETLTGNGQFTVFAPTDDAFAAIEVYPENVGDLPQDFLTDVLLYHVAPGRRYSPDVLASDRIRTLYRGKYGFLFQSGGTLTDNLGRDANILLLDVDGDSNFDTIDIEAANGVIHAIDAVVLPYLP